MLESVGKKLHAARTQRGISVEEAAHATKLRPDKIVALENDDYARFGSNAYAKGFLQIYSRYLGVDAAEVMRTLDSTNHISVADYQYLSNGMGRQEPERDTTFSFHPKRQVPSIVPLIAFATLIVLGLFAFQIYVNWQRVTGEPGLGVSPAGAAEKVQTSPLAPTPAPAPAVAAAPKAPPPAATTLDGLPVRRAEPVLPAAPPLADPAERALVAPPPVAAGPVNRVLVEPLKKTWIIVRLDDPNSAPIFEDYLYPDAPPLPVKGARIFIEARDPSAIVIRKNGTPIAYVPGAEIR